MLDLTPIANALIGLCATAITVFVIPWIYAKAGKERADSLMKWAKIGVQAAEQIYRDKENAGELKKLRVEQFLMEHGFRLNSQEVEQAIEAAVREMNQSFYVGADLKPPINEPTTADTKDDGDSYDGNMDTVQE